MIAASFLALGAACAAPERPSDTELYRLALAAAQTELGLAPPIQLHPFPTNLDADGGLRPAHRLDFNTFDSLTVPRLVRADPAGYRVCAPDVSGSCELANGEAALVVSNLLDVERDAVGLVLIVMDRRGGARAIRYYAVRVKHSLGKWQVVEFRHLT